MPQHSHFPRTTFISSCPQSLIYSSNGKCLNGGGREGGLGWKDGGREGKRRRVNRTSPNESKSAALRQTRSANSEKASNGETPGAVLFQTESGVGVEREKEGECTGVHEP